MLWLYKLWKIACRFSSQTLWIYFDPLFTISTKIIKRSRSSICAPPPSCLAHTHAHANTHLEGVERERERELREKWSRRALPSTKTRQTTRPLSRPPNPTPPSLPLSLSLSYTDRWTNFFYPVRSVLVEGAWGSVVLSEVEGLVCTVQNVNINVN